MNTPEVIVEDHDDLDEPHRLTDHRRRFTTNLE